MDNVAKSSFLIVLSIFIVKLAASDRQDSVGGGYGCKGKSCPKKPLPSLDVASLSDDEDDAEELALIREMASKPLVNDVFETDQDAEATKKELWLLISKGQIHKVCNEFGSTPLHVAAMHGDEALVKALLSAGAKQLVVDRDGNTPLHVAILYRHVGVIRLLLTHVNRAVFSIRNKRTYTVVGLAHGTKSPAIIALFSR